MLSFDEWKNSKDFQTVVLNWESKLVGDYEEDEYDAYLKDKYEEYKAMRI